MKKIFLRVIALILAICAMQVVLVPPVFAAGSSADKKAKPVLAQEMVTYSWQDGVFCGIAEVLDHDYLALPINGGRMYIYDLDEMSLVDMVDTGISAPRGATVDRDGNIWVSGNAPYLYQYNLYTFTGKNTENFAGVGCALPSISSAYAISQGDDDYLYFGVDNGGQIVKYDIQNETFEKINYPTTGITENSSAQLRYAAAVLQKGDYIYVALTDSEVKHYLVKLDAKTYQRVDDVVNTSSILGTAPYLENLAMLDDTTIVGPNGVGMIVDVTTMQTIEKTVGGAEFSIKGNVSDGKDGKVYFTTYEKGLCAYDPTTKKVSYVAGSAGAVGMRSNSGSVVTLNVKNGKVVPQGQGGEVRKCLITYYDSKIALNAVDLANPSVTYSLKGLVAENAGAGNNLGGLAAGLPGSNKLYTGAFESDQVYVYNTATGNLEKSLQTATMQTDSLHQSKDKLYSGNYTLAQLTELDFTSNKPRALFTLKDGVFNQTRINAITSGDNMVFAATIPIANKNGGVIAWYDYSANNGNGRAYVAVGPNPEDVYYSDNSVLPIKTGGTVDEAALSSVTWYNKKTGAKRADNINVNGLIAEHSIISLVYHDGILFGTSSRSGGKHAPFGDGNAVLFAYDVNQGKVIKTDNLSSLEFGYLNYIGGVAADPDVATNGKFWGVAAETLFSFTFNKTTGTFSLKNELSFSKAIDLDDGGRYEFPRPILFDGDYMYVAFSRTGNLCKIEKNNPNNYQKLLPDTQDIRDIPFVYTLANDGSLYYVKGSDLVMINTNPTDNEWQKAEAIDARIESAGPQLSMDEVKQIRDDYAALTNREKSLIQNVTKLSTLESDVVIAKINAISTAENFDAAVEDARKAYDSLSRKQATAVTNYESLVTAEKVLAGQLTVELTKPDASTVLCNSLTEALANATDGSSVKLLTNIDQDTVNVPTGVTLDLNGKTLTVENIAGCVMDSADGKGLIQVSEQDAALKSPGGQWILWDEDASGYRVFTYTFESKGLDANKTDATESTETTAVKSFWSELRFENRDAYKLIASGSSGLGVGFDVSWTPNGGTAVSKSYEFGSDVVAQWGEAEMDDTENAKAYYFYIRITGFENLEGSGTLKVKPVIQDKFGKSTTAGVMYYQHGSQGVINLLEYMSGYGVLPSDLS